MNNKRLKDHSYNNKNIDHFFHAKIHISNYLHRLTTSKPTSL